MKSAARNIAFGGSLFLMGCDQRAQSILDPRSAEAGTISDLWWVMFILGSLVFIAVMFFMLVAVLGKSGSKPPGGSMRFVWAGGIIFPAIILVGLLIYSLKASFALSPSEEGITIEVEGPGLPDTANLFVPFFTTKPNGSGIGLALSRQIAEAHGGTLTLENRKDGAGCVARVRLGGGRS